MIEGRCHCGAVDWRFEGVPDSGTTCNCTICRRYGVIWAYDYEGEGIHTQGSTRAYLRADGGDIEFHFCPTCGCVTWWRGAKPDDKGRRRIAVNLRLAEPDAVADIAIRRFRGLDWSGDLSPDGRCVSDYWF